LPLVHDSGGVKEIVTNDLLRYQNADDLVNRISYLMRNDSMRREVFGDLQKALTRFKKSNFFLALKKIFLNNGLLH